ncbi:uncharacterized protein LY89DRAFT_147261 [Mollisia scopiformis]|uniref:Heterokaryon incompatibility domain-containing protein n=1 Tax=Mollisia scopiformis TaxID=149040 RepID=A0A194X0R4_MOLSC|nr:uncharacterized protein LY89DRAFT_147261 [Mollisia scopiformis]KUJ13791.1 hypothetical protein LY89DRAFT_147261 [Mollisia scopiformis]
MEATGTISVHCPKIPRDRDPRTLRGVQKTVLKPPLETQAFFALHPRFQWVDFEAISYCWESDVRDRTIVIDDVPFDVPKNLEALLQSLRTLPDAKSGMKFWGDALCINQDNTSERNHQVKLMKSIYSKAFAIIVWLGGSTDDSGEAIDFMASITQFTLDNNENEGGHFDFEKWETSVAKLQKKRFSELPWKALMNFLNRAYWRRLWIIQELALNHNMTLFLCGDRQLSRSKISRTCHFCETNIGVIDHLVSTCLDLETTSPSTMYGSVWPTVYHVNKLLGTRDQEIDPRSVDNILDLGRKANVTDTRDKVYGILGILPRELSTMITPDYGASNPVEKVYYEFACKMLDEYKRLDSMISWCSYNAGSSLPSWVPNWTSKFSRNHVQWLKRRTASGVRKGEWAISPQERRLHSKGIIVDHIKTSTSSHSETLPFRTQQPRHSTETEKTEYSHRYGSLKCLSAALQRTLVMHHPKTRQREMGVLDIYWIDWDEDQTEKSLNTMDSITQNLCWESFDRFRHTNANFSIFGHRFRDIFPKMQISSEGTSQEDDSTRECASAMLIAVLASIGRRLVTTTGGHLGLAPEEVQEHDVVAILYGCNFPVVLRPHGDSFLMIGECYVDGIMDGEFLQTKEIAGVRRS